VRSLAPITLQELIAAGVGSVLGGIESLLQSAVAFRKNAEAVMRDCREARYRWPCPPSYGRSVKLMARTAQRRVARARTCSFPAPTSPTVMCHLE
jgi:hypothetical protein